MAPTDRPVPLYPFRLAASIRATAACMQGGIEAPPQNPRHPAHSADPVGAVCRPARHGGGDMGGHWEYLLDPPRPHVGAHRGLGVHADDDAVSVLERQRGGAVVLQVRQGQREAGLAAAGSRSSLQEEVVNPQRCTQASQAEQVPVQERQGRVLRGGG
eukprot:CAMPEP_0173264614 /NCGR_PEP_ID=MMETSP1142-20121109/28073_1 /TAXON_ID=483371 /ORGANISM="non described non described, Strain CCMP2298" /LENGTH=157 /DNA_ID=CAMNT_0014200173 /DNA_START=118 /DNA_END=590 /DNA_ORIENTATION=-